MNKPVPGTKTPPFQPMFTSLDITHEEISRKKSSITYNGREMIVTMRGMRCMPNPESKTPVGVELDINTQELSFALAMKLIEAHKKMIAAGTLPPDNDPDYLMESMNRGWLQSYVMITLRKSLLKLTDVYKDKPFDIELKFQYFRKSLGKEHGMYVYDRNIKVDAYQGSDEQRVNVRRLADEKYTARFCEKY